MRPEVSLVGYSRGARKEASLVKASEASIVSTIRSRRLLHEEVCWSAKGIVRILIHAGLRR